MNILAFSLSSSSQFFPSSTKLCHKRGHEGIPAVSASANAAAVAAITDADETDDILLTSQSLYKRSSNTNHVNDANSNPDILHAVIKYNKCKKRSL